MRSRHSRNATKSPRFASSIALRVIVMTIRSVGSVISIQYARRASLLEASLTNGLLGSTIRSGSGNESFGHTEWSLHRILRCISINLTEDLCLFVKRIHLHLHKLG